MVSGDGRGCNTDSGEFIVEDIAFSGGTLTRLAISFVQHCGAKPDGLMGEVRYHEPWTTGLRVQAQSLLFPPQYIGVANTKVPLWVTNTSAVPVEVGSVTAIGPGAADVVVSGSTCPSMLGPAETCTITIVVTPGAAGWRQSIVSVASGSSPATVAVTDPGIAGNAAFVVDSEPAEQIAHGQQATFNQFNSTIIGTNDSQNSVTLVVENATHTFSAIVAAPPGHNLAVGTYGDASFAAGHPMVDVWGDSAPLCPAPTGQFTVREIAFDGGGNVSRFAADVEMHCYGSTQALFVGLRFASTIGYNAIDVQPSAGPLTFGSQAVYTTSPAQQLTIVNTGVVAISMAPAIAGTDSGDFRLTSSSCSSHAPLSSGAVCTVAVNFTPHGIGPRSALLVFSDSTPRGHHIFALNATGTGPVAFIYPDGSHMSLVDTTKPFVWAALPGAQAYLLVVSTTPNDANLVNSGVLPATRTQYAVPAMPTDRLIYATLFIEVAGRWDHYQTITFGAMAQVAYLINPFGTAVPTDRTKPFQWTTSYQAQGYYLVVGTRPGIADITNSGVLPPGQSTYAHPVLPAGTTLYATIFTEWLGHWNYYQSISFRTTN